MMVDFSFDNLSGEIDLSERGIQDEQKFWTSENLVNAEVEKSISFSLTDDEDDDETQITLSMSHVENNETKRAFHAHISIYFDREEIEQLRDALNFVIKNNKRDD